MKITFVEAMVYVAVALVVASVAYSSIKYGFNTERADGYSYTYLDMQ